MKTYILFGKTGSGKSFVGDHLQNHYGFHHFDGDLILTETMKEFVNHGKKFTQEMVDEYTANLKEKIRLFYENYRNPVVISQGLYRNKNRLEILQEFPTIQYIFITADEKICYERVEKRKNWVTVSYAKEISQIFESPLGFNYVLINNNKNDILSLETQIEEQLGIKKNHFFQPNENMLKKYKYRLLRNMNSEQLSSELKTHPYGNSEICSKL